VDLAEGDNAISISAVVAGTEAGQITRPSVSVAEAPTAVADNGSNGGPSSGPDSLPPRPNAGHFASSNVLGFWSHESNPISRGPPARSHRPRHRPDFHVRMQNGWNLGGRLLVGFACQHQRRHVWELYFNAATNY
jgi:hypothetical protein